MDEVLHHLTMPRIGAVVAATGSVGPAKMAEVARDVADLAAMGRRHGAEHLLLGATEAVRRAGDRDAVLDAVSEAAGVPCRLISQEAEARLSYRGAASTLHGDEGEVLVVDVGGASTECVLGSGMQPRVLAGLPIGSGVAVDRWMPSDPPTETEWDGGEAAVASLVASLPRGAPRHARATGGTATTLPLLLQGGSRLDAADLARCRRMLTAHGSTEVARRHGIDATRARVLPGGVVILEALRRHYGVDALHVTERGLRFGMVLAWRERGEDWPEG